MTKHLTKVTLHNYRSHEHTELALEQLTSLIGENDCGKSNVYRALDMVLTNSPFSEGALRYGTKEGWVRVEFHDGMWIERHRKGTKQKAVLFDGKTTTEYDTIKDIPKIVEDFTGFKPIILDKQSKPESVQLIPIDAGQAFMVTGNSSEVVQRRIQRLMHGAGIETAKIVLEKEQRTLVTKAERDQAEYDTATSLVDILESQPWLDAITGWDDLGSIMDQMETLAAKGDLLLKFEEMLPTIERDRLYSDCMDEIDRHVIEFNGITERMTTLEESKAKIKPQQTKLTKALKQIVDGNGILVTIKNDIADLNTKIEAEEAEERERVINQKVEERVQQVATTTPEAKPTDVEQRIVDMLSDEEIAAPVNLVLDTIDCLRALSQESTSQHGATAGEIADDWSELCPAS